MKNTTIPFFILSLTLLISGQALGKIQKGSEAFGAPGMQGSWSSAKKVNVGTIYESKLSSVKATSPLWFTSAEGMLTEVYFPTIDQGQIRDSQLLVTDGESFFHQEKDLSHSTEVLSPSMARITNIDTKGRYQISHTYFTLKDSATLVDEIEVVANVDGLKFFLLTNPQLNNNAANDKAWIQEGSFSFKEARTNLKVTSSVGFKKMSVGFAGNSDGYQDLVRDLRMDYEFLTATNGNVTSTGEINIPEVKGTYKFYVIYQFSDKAELKNLAKIKNFESAKNQYEDSWKNYFATLKIPKNLTKAQKLLFLRSLYTLKSHEDKLNPGAFIASLSVPWGEDQKEYPGTEIGGYHLIWPRDLFNVSVALLNSGDYESSLDSLRFLKKIQYKAGSGAWYLFPRVIEKEGAFPQNTWVTGRTYWEGFQLDQTAFPIHLYYHLYLKTPDEKKARLFEEFEPMLVSALNVIMKNGPWTHQERWEENFGISPSSFAAAASALLIGEKIFTDSWGKQLGETARSWLTKPNDNIDTWTYTTNGVYGDGQYYLRMAGGSAYGAVWNPNDQSNIFIANSGYVTRQDKVVDQGFLQLALLGLKPASSEKIKKSKAVVDKEISVMTPKGRAWYRYSFDAYGEDKKGRLWTLLSGEHGRYFIERYSAGDMNWSEVENETNTIVKSMINFANDGLMIPEQLFENTGTGTGGATPLAWSHAEYIKLMWSIEKKHNVENLLR